jgi:5-methylcytosine-specific restriction endonuclease McrA
MVGKNVERQVAFRSQGRCENEKCRLSLVGRTSHLHHKNGNSKDNRLDNLLLLCPNCHDKAHNGKLTRAEIQREGTIVFPPFKALDEASKKAFSVVWGKSAE